MPLKFVYFAVRGRGQAFKYLCEDNGIAYQEELVDFKDWPAKKATTTLGQLPVVFDGDFQIGQSNAILRHVARQHGLYGKDEKEATTIDMLNDQQEDYRGAYLQMIYKSYDTEKDTFIKSLPEKLAVLEKLLGKNNGGKGYFVGAKQSFVDYTIFDLLDNFVVLSPTSLDGTPLLKAFHARIAAKDKIAKMRATDAFKKTNINGNGKQ